MLFAARQPSTASSRKIISSSSRSNNLCRRAAAARSRPNNTFFAAASSSSTPSKDVVGKKIIVKVQPKQTLSIVSKENGISVRDIVRLNGLGSRRTLRVGEELIVSDFEVGGGEGTFQIIERKEMTTTSEKEEEEEEEEEEKKEEKKESVASTSSSTTTEEKSQEQNAKNILRLVPENAKEAIMRKIERFKVETSKSAVSTASKAAVVVQQSVTTSVPFTTSFGVGVGAAVLSMALVATNIGRGGERKDKEEEEEKKETEVESSSGKSSDSDSSTASAPVVKQEEEKVVETAALAEKEATTVVEEKVIAPPPPPPPPVVEAVEEKEDVVEVARSQSQSPAPLERLKGWMDGERDKEDNFESSIEEFKAKLAAAQDALIVLQDQLEQSKRNKKNNQK
jgi:LysM repeat protein